jgi:hypothetical protein
MGELNDEDRIIDIGNRTDGDWVDERSKRTAMPRDTWRIARDSARPDEKAAPRSIR